MALLTGAVVALGAVAWPFTKAHMQAVAVLRLVSGQPVPRAINKLVTEPMEEPSPHGLLRTMTTPVYLLHGQTDNIIPAAETLWMASELPGATLQEALVSPVLSHVNLDGPKPGLWEQWRLVHFFALVMHKAERK